MEKQQIQGKSVAKETSVLAAVSAQRDPTGWMDRYSNAPGVSNGLAVMSCNAPLSDGAKVYFRSVTRFNPAAHVTLVKVEAGGHMVVNSSEGVCSLREVGV